MTYIQKYDKLYATSLTPEFHEKTAGYWFTVTNGATAHTAFATRKGLDRWLYERGLKLERDIPDYSDPGVIPSRDNWREGGTKILGEYREASHGKFSDEPYSPDYPDGPRKMIEDDEWKEIVPIAATADMSNGRYTLALITESEGVRTVHTLNPNVKTRVEFDSNATRKYLESAP